MGLPALKLPEPVMNGHSREQTNALRSIGKQVRDSVRATLRQSTDLKDLAYETAMSLRGIPDDSESADKARSRAMAVSAAIKAYKDMTDIIRIVRGKALPVAKREVQPKPSKQVAFNPFKEQ